MRSRTEGATVLISGTNRGLGRTLVQGFLDAGARKVFAAMRKKIDVFFDSRIEVIILDVTSDASVTAAADRCGPIDILVNNAACLFNTPSINVGSLDGARMEMETNYWGLLRMARTFAPLLREKHGGTIMNILSIGSLACVPFAGTYCASKAAAWSLTQGLRAELRGQGTSVVAVFPGPIATEMARAQDTGERHRPEDITAAIIEKLNKGETMIFPDSSSQAIAKRYNASPWSLERMLAARQ